MKVLISICARGGSKGIPGKNIRKIGGKPLIAYSIDTAMRLAEILHADIGLSTDDEMIKKVASKFGLNTEYVRPPELATDHAGKLEVIKILLFYHESLRGEKYDFHIDLDVTSPLRTVEDILAGLDILKDDSCAMNLVSVNDAHRNPYFNMVEENHHGYFKLVKKGDYLTRQSSPKVYDLNGSFYIFRRSFFEENLSTINEKTLIYKMPHICFDLDEEIDFEFMSYLIENNKLNFHL